MLYSQLCHQKWKGGSNINWWHKAGNRNEVKCSSGCSRNSVNAMGSELAAVRMKVFSSWAPLAMNTAIYQGRRWLAGWECVSLELVHELRHVALVSHSLTVSLWYTGSIVLVCITCKADQQSKGRFNDLVQGSFKCQLESCVCLHSQGIFWRCREEHHKWAGDGKAYVVRGESSVRFVSASRMR